MSTYTSRHYPLNLPCFLLSYSISLRFLYPTFSSYLIFPHRLNSLSSHHIFPHSLLLTIPSFFFFPPFTHIHRLTSLSSYPLSLLSFPMLSAGSVLSPTPIPLARYARSTIQSGKSIISISVLTYANLTRVSVINYTYLLLINSNYYYY